MSRQAPTYDNITSLTADLTNSTKTLTSRRKTAKELVQKLSDRNIQRKLASEVSPGNGTDHLSFEARRCRALSALWSNGLVRCIQMTREILQQSKTKCTLDDIRLPDKIIRVASKPDDAFDSNGLSILKLSKKSVRSALKFCLEALEDEGNLPEGGDRILVDMLAFLCSREEYMGCFKYMNDFQRTLSEILHHVEEHTNHKQGHSDAMTIFESACRAFSNFFGTCCQLGIEVHLFVSDTLQIMSEWSKIDIENQTPNSSSTCRQHIFSGIASILYSHPAESIGPMKRYGTHLLRCCKKAYPRARDAQKEALNQYLVSHLFVAQAAGKIQGMIDGDLGDLGSASLTESQLLSLLVYSIEDIVNAKEFRKDSAAIPMSRLKRQKASKQALWEALSPRLRLQLELVARLLACSQRLYIAREGWNALGNPEEMLSSLLKVPGPDKDEEWVDSEPSEPSKLSPDVIAKSPWMTHVFRKLLPSNYNDTRSEKITKSGKSSLDPSKHMISLLLNDSIKANKTHESSVPYLAITGACAELFPAGECWALSPVENWFRIIPEEKTEDLIWYHGASVLDLVSILTVLSWLLERHGHPEGEPHDQYWILLTMTKLTETTALSVRNYENNPHHLHLLAEEWRKIWRILVRRDLRYACYSSHVGENSLGEMVAILLTEMISRRCTETFKPETYRTLSRESSFVFEHQKDIWSLELFEAQYFLSSNSRVQFELILAVSRFAGLSHYNTVGGKHSSLRQRLLQISVDSLMRKINDEHEHEHSSEISFSSQVMEGMVSCILCLANGYHSSIIRPSANDWRFALVRPSTKPLSSMLRFTITQIEQQQDQDEWIRILWGTKEEVQVHYKPDLSFSSIYEAYFDTPRLVARKLRSATEREDRKLHSNYAQSIPGTGSGDLLNAVLEILKEEVHSSSGYGNGISYRPLKTEVSAMKVIVSLLVTSSGKMDFLSELQRIVSFLEKSTLKLIENPLERDDYVEVAKNLDQLFRTVKEIRSRHSTRTSFEEDLSTVIRRCRRELEEFSPRPSYSFSSDYMRKAGYISNGESRIQFDLMSDPSSPKARPHEGTQIGPKRGLLSHDDHEGGTKKRRKTSSLTVLPPDFKCAAAIASLLITMAPSVANCKLACEALLGPLVNIDVEGRKGDVDPEMVLVCFRFLRTEEIWMNRSKGLDFEASRETRPLQLMYRAIELLRKSAEPYSHFHMYGNTDCAEIAVGMFILGLELSEEEMLLITNVIAAREGMRGRPVLRAERNQASTFVFEKGSDAFHESFDKVFANGIVRVGFDDTNILVRRSSFIAAGVACSRLDEERILTDIRSSTAPIALGSSTQEIIKRFSDWYVGSGLSSTEEEERSNAEAKDALETLESDAIFAKAVLAGSARKRQTFARMLKEIFEVSRVRPGLEFMCYRALERIAWMRGHLNVKELVDIEGRGMLAAFLDNVPKSNSVLADELFPPSLTSPKSVWYIMMHGRYEYFSQSQLSPKWNEESIVFRKSAALNFVWCNRNFVVPFALMRCHDIIDDGHGTSGVIDLLSKEPGIRVVVDGLDGMETDGNHTIIKLIRRHLVDIQAFSVLLSCTNDVKKKQIGQNMLRIMTETLSQETVESKTEKNLFLIVRRIFLLVPAENECLGIGSHLDITHYRAIVDVTNKIFPPKLSGDRLIHAGSSLSEFTVYAFSKLVKSENPNHLINAFSRFEVLVRLLRDHMERNDGSEQIGFFLHVLAAIIIDPSLKHLRPQGLRLILNVLREALAISSEGLNSQVASVTSELVCACFHIHDSVQRKLLQVIRNKGVEFGMISLKPSARLSRHEAGSEKDLLPSGMTNIGVGEISLLHACLEGTFEILLCITQHMDVLELDPKSFIAFSETCETSWQDLEILKNLDERYCAQKLARDLSVFGETEHTSLDYHVSRMASQMHESQFLSNEIKFCDRNPDMDPFNNTHERLVCAELLQLANLMKHSTSKRMGAGNVKFLCNYLCCTCAQTRSRQVTLAASRCIALLNPSVVFDAFGIEGRLPSSLGSDIAEFLLGLKAKCIDRLARCLKSPIPKIATVAVMALERILSYEDARKVSSLLTTTTNALIQPFFAKHHYSKPNGIPLSKEEVKTLMQSISDEAESMSWCWAKRFWSPSYVAEIGFERWIRELTSAIVVCCVDPSEENSKPGDRSNTFSWKLFYWHIQRLAYMDHTFASAVFPSLILSLLQDDAFNDNDSLATLITRSFENLLDIEIGPQSSTGPVSKAVSIIIDTLDLLRKYAQHVFLSSNKRGSKKSPKKRSIGGIDHDASWRGLPFGVMLHLDGLVVAGACMAVERHASALYFLDMFLNSLYGKSGGVLEQLNDCASCMDVLQNFQGFPYICGGGYIRTTIRLDDRYLKDVTTRAMSMISKCYKELGEFDLVHAVTVQQSSLNFTVNNDSILAHDVMLSRHSPLNRLQSLSLQLCRSVTDNDIFLPITGAMEELGLHGLIKSYIEGVQVRNKGLQQIDTAPFREKWFEANLMTQNWSAASANISQESFGTVNTLTSAKFSPTGRSSSKKGFFELVTEGFNLFSTSATKDAKLALDEARSCVINSISNMAPEQVSASRFVVMVDQFRSLEDLENLFDEKDDFSVFDYDQADMLEISLRVRQISLLAYASTYQDAQEQMLGGLKEHLWRSCDSAIDGCRLQVAENALSELRRLMSTAEAENQGSLIGCSHEILRIRLAEAKLMECRGDFNGAIHRIKQVTGYIRNEDRLTMSRKCMLTDAQILCGSWMTKYKTQQARVVLESYLYPATSRAKDLFIGEKSKENAERASRASFTLGHVLANLYDDLLLRVNSTEWKETEKKLQNQHNQFLESETVRKELKVVLGKSRKSGSTGERAVEAHRQLVEFQRLEKDYNEMSKERQSIKTSIPFYLNHAMNLFLSALAMSGTDSDDLTSHVSRMISLWFACQNSDEDVAKTNQAVHDELRQVPSFRFVPLTNQLFAHIESHGPYDDKDFQNVLQSLIFRMCHDHPYHCLAPLVALKNGKIETKVTGAKDLIKRLSQCDTSYVRYLVESYTVLVSSYNLLAHASTKKYEDVKHRKKNMKIKFSEIFRSSSVTALDSCLRNLPAFPCVITSPPLLRPGKDYGDGEEDPIGGELIAKFESDFAITESGKNRPKIVMCIGSRGGRFRQLVKGEDDIRQDAIMSQVFNYVNTLMKRRVIRGLSSNGAGHSNGPSRHNRHKLKMITYNILPLSPSSGVIEWVEGAMPIMYIINDRRGLIGTHSRYYPEELSGDKCFFALKKCERGTKEEKKQAFDDICSQYSPSFRLFFLESYGDCMELWHLAKMNYTRSVAVSSIVGHILGIGDRHLGNILIDQKTGEVVHIDFGFVFEQGKLLPIPECIPFRLTRNMVDGMGPCGIEGLFVKVAEQTMSVLRNHDKELLAILSAVVTDPLYTLNIKPSAGRRRKSGKQKEADLSSEEDKSSGMINSQNTATTINKIKEKLQGYEDSTSGEQQGVEGQVQLLINSARDPNNLCRLFAGWAPWD